MSKAKRPWMKWYPADWRSDPGLRMCSFAARGLWADLLALMHEAEPYGCLVVNGMTPSYQQLAAMLGGTAKQVEALMGELEGAGVFSRDDDGVIYSRRMVRDHAASLEGKTWVEKRWANRGATGDPNRDPNRGATPTPITQKPEARSQRLETEKPITAPAAPSPDGEGYAWSGRVIRLSRRDYDRWRESYPNVEIDAELQAADDYYADKAPKNGWFFAVSNWLKRANAQARGSPGEAAPDNGADRF